MVKAGRNRGTLATLLGTLIIQTHIYASSQFRVFNLLLFWECCRKLEVLEATQQTHGEHVSVVLIENKERPRKGTHNPLL